jgi:hypothetical protein
MGRSEHWDRIAALADQARDDVESFQPPEDPPRESDALSYLREGLGPVVMVYINGRTGGDLAPFSETEFVLMERALNDWLQLYARCYGEVVETEVTVREAAELLIDTRNVQDVAQILTRVPQRASTR